jgi:hypothetical protein
MMCGGLRNDIYFPSDCRVSSTIILQIHVYRGGEGLGAFISMDQTANALTTHVVNIELECFLSLPNVAFSLQSFTNYMFTGKSTT